MELDFEGKTAIVTGSGRGIGEEIAYEFADAGANVVVAARTASELEDTVSTIEERGGDATAVSIDLTDVSGIDQLLDSAVEAYGTPDILVNNAGVLITHDFKEGSDVAEHVGAIDTMLDINMRAIYVLSLRFGELLRDRSADGGRIINISSILGQLGVSGRGVYSGTKSGIYGLNRGIAADLSEQNITVNSVSPGLVAVDRIDEILEEEPERFNIDKVPAGRLGKPEDIAAACLFLASEQAEYINGQDILVDGGTAFTAGLYE